MGDTVSAVPSVLEGWAAWAQAQNPTLTSAARRADAAIQAFNSSKPDPAVVTHPVPYPGENVVSYTARNGTVDQWVGKVGEAFFAIATKNVPSGALEYEASYYSNKRITADESAVEQRVGGDPVAQAKAAGDAAEMHEALDRNDGGTVRRMANGLSPYVQKGDGDYLAAYYKDLGPDYTVKATHYMDDLKDPAQAAALKTFDQGLVTATNQPGWDRSFDDRVFAKGTEDRPADPHQFLLLAYASAPHAASYSANFLEKAGDAYFFQDRNAPRLPDTKVTGPEPANWVLHAISLNHKAAADWLTGRPPGQEGQDTVTRLQALIVGPSSQGGALQMGHNEKAVNDLIAAAGQPDGGKSKQLLNLFASLPPEMVADGFKSGIARAAGENIPTLLQEPKDVQERILQFATKNADGSANDEAALAFADESGKYLRTLVNGSEMRSENLYHVWDKASEVLTLLHDNLHDIDEDEEHAKEIRDSVLWGAVDLAPLPGKGLLKDAAEYGKSALVRTIETYQNTHGEPPDPRSQIDFQVRTLIAEQYVAQHPDLVGHDHTADDVALGLATGRVENVPGHKALEGDKGKNDEMYDFLNFVHGVRSNGGE